MVRRRRGEEEVAEGDVHVHVQSYTYYMENGKSLTERRERDWKASFVQASLPHLQGKQGKTQLTYTLHVVSRVQTDLD